MQINWTLITCVVIVFFALSGYSRGWWKEAITTAFLAGLVLLLQQPDWANSLINGFNSLVSTIWGFIPSSIQTLINNILVTFLDVSAEGTAAPQANATDPGTWIIILALVVVISTLLGRVALKNRPTSLGAFLGATVGGLNGFLVLNLIREYMDGRALPGRATFPTEITRAGASAFGPASPTISIQATNLPNFTILDNAIPYLVVGLGVLLAVAVISTGYPIRTKDGGVKIDNKALPPFYKGVAPPKPTQLNTLVKDIKKMFNES